MNPNETQVDEILKRLVAALVIDVDSIRIERADFVRRRAWTVRVHLDDAGKVIGKKGAHLQALALLVGLIGVRCNERFELKFEKSEDTGEFPRDTPAPQPQEQFNASEATALLHDLLALVLESPARIAVTSRVVHPMNRRRETDPKVEITFAISAGTVQDNELLKEDIGPDPEKRVSPEAALGTLWRAIGKKDGVSFVIKVA